MTAVIVEIARELASPDLSFEVCGFINRKQEVFPLGSDTKVLSTVFELLCRPIVNECAERFDYKVVEPTVQNHYPDFTLHKPSEPLRKIAIDVKTTYRDREGGRFSYTLGGYTSFIREGNERKNIVFPFGDYASHWVIGFVYTRTINRKSVSSAICELNKLDEIVVP
jgi:Restriction endonuclease EcoRV